MIQEKDFSKNKYILYARKSTEAEDRQVASIESQIEVMGEVANEAGLKIVEVMSESGSGFHVGRNVFNEMTEKILRREADGIIVWKLSRLSRNPDDAGRIMGMLQREEIKHIRTVDRNWFPEDNVLTMYVEFGMHNQFSRDLSVDARRGLMQKAERGWYPNPSVPIGYLHNPYKSLGDAEIVKDSDRFDLMQFGLKAVASGRLLPKEALEEVMTKGLTSRRSGKIANSTWYRALVNPFYYGEFEYPNNSGKFHQGKHPPMITELEFDRIQEVLGRKGKPRPKKHFFSYTGLIKCGECGCSIVADPKTKHQRNGNIHDYLYYRCSKKKGACSQKTVEIKKLEPQIKGILSRIKIPEEFHKWAIEELKIDQAKEVDDRKQTLNSARKRYDDVTEKIDKLVEGWIDGKIPEDTYNRKLAEFKKIRNTANKILNNADSRIDERIKMVEEVLDFASMASYKFKTGDDITKREIFSRIGSNFVLKDGKLSVELKKPLELVSKISQTLPKSIKKLEPPKSIDGSSELVTSMASSSVIRREGDSNPR